MKKITTVGVDLAKSVFTVHGVDATGRTVLRKTVRREKLMELIAGLAAVSDRHGSVRRRARVGAASFSATATGSGIMMARFVAPYRKSSKNDGNDAEAICEAVARPNMRFVPVKSAEQQAILSLHRVRQGFVEQRTATINRIRGLLAEFGMVLPQRADEVRRAAVVVAEELPVLAREAITDLRAHLTYLDERIDPLRAAAGRLGPTARGGAYGFRRMPGVGPLTASAITASVGDGHEFANGRQFAAWLGLVPRQYSTGGKHALGPHHQARRRLPAHAADARRPRRVAERRAEVGSPVALGDGVARASRLSPRDHRHRRQERTHHLGAAGERSSVRAAR